MIVISYTVAPYNSHFGRIQDSFAPFTGVSFIGGFVSEPKWRVYKTLSRIAVVLAGIPVNETSLNETLVNGTKPSSVLVFQTDRYARFTQIPATGLRGWTALRFGFSLFF